MTPAEYAEQLRNIVRPMWSEVEDVIEFLEELDRSCITERDMDTGEELAYHYEIVVNAKSGYGVW